MYLGQVCIDVATLQWGKFVYLGQVFKCGESSVIPVGIFLDLSKAFDTLDHSILLQKLNHCGIRGISNDWIKNYLKGRHQFVVYDKTSSVTNTIPQGSILGPLPFLLYINDLPKCSSSLDFILFADDTNIICSNDPDTLETVLNKDLHIISNWFKLNKLSLNVAKTNYMIFKNKYSPTTSKHRVNISIDNNQLSQVKTTKFLGVLIDDNLSWKTHTTHVCNIISKYNGIIRKVRQFLPSDSLPTLFNTLVYPYINYCAIIWADNNNSHRDNPGGATHILELLMLVNQPRKFNRQRLICYPKWRNNTF